MTDHDRDDELAERLGRALGHDPTEVPPPARVAAVRAAANAHRATATGSSLQPELRPDRSSRRRAFVTGTIAAGVAGVAGYLAGEARQPQPTTASAVPVEQITFAGDADVSTSALINHAWGTELLLDVAGLRAGEPYDVVYDTDAGEVGAGSLLAVPDVLMRCRFNAAPLRATVHAIELRSPTGNPVLRAELPDTPT